METDIVKAEIIRWFSGTWGCGMGSMLFKECSVALCPDLISLRSTWCWTVEMNVTVSGPSLVT